MTERHRVEPGGWLGMLGGGQLGRMFCQAAHALGYKVLVLDPDPDSPAGRIADEHLQADYLDEAALDRLAARCAAVSTEFENVPAQALARLGAKVVVSPNAQCVSVAQDRIAEKNFFHQAGVATAPYAVIDSASVIPKLDPALYPGILKTARMGYDGKGQVQVASNLELAYSWNNLKQVACVLEQKLVLAAELSVIVVRDFQGQMAAYPPAQNQHHQGILAVSFHPAQTSPELAQQAIESAQAIARAMNYVGVLCVEFFVLSDGRLVANEMAPRPHNSGHYSIDACYCSQFEQQVRVMAGLPIGSTFMHSPAVMLNLLGDIWTTGGKAPNWDRVLQYPEAKLHLYGKSEPRAGRKMGHITILGERAHELSQKIAHDLGISAIRDAVH